jgi:hypothetical protein
MNILNPFYVSVYIAVTTFRSYHPAALGGPMHRCSNVSKAVDMESVTAQWEGTQWLWRRFGETEVKPDFTKSESIFVAQIKSIIFTASLMMRRWQKCMFARGFYSSFF